MQQLFWSEMAKRAVPYTPGEQPRDQVYIKLNTNECPYPPSPALKDIDMKLEQLRLYPDPTAQKLRKEIAARYHLNADEVFVGNGSDEVLAFSFMAFTSKDIPISYADITYSFYPVYARIFQSSERIVPLRKDFELNLDDYEGGNGPVIIANPNAPTGLAISTERMVRFLEENPQRLLIVDEAYVDFGADTMAAYIHQYPNLLVIQTFSKSRALAGARLGFALGQVNLIEALDRIKNSFNSYTISRFTQEAGAASMADEAYFQWTCRQIIETRDALIVQLREKGFEVTDSKTNFLWMRKEGFSGEALYQGLRSRGILVRHFQAEAIKDYIRVTIGTKEDMEQFKAALFDLIA